MSYSKKEDNEFSFLLFLSSNDEDAIAGEKCIFSIDEMVSSHSISENRHRGEADINIGFRNMGIFTEIRRVLIRQWSDKLGKGFTDWLSHDKWYTYIHCKFMAWRILQVKYLKSYE